MGFIIQGVFKLFQLAIMLFWKSGCWAFLLWLTIFEFTIAKLMPKPFYDGIGGAIFGWGLGLVIWALVFANNIGKLISQNPNFSLFKIIMGLITGRKTDIGTVANTNEVKAENLQGMVFGKLANRYVIKPENEMGSALIIGGTRSGKTSGLCIPTVKSWKGGLFAIDIKGELYDTTHQSRPNRIKRFNPTDKTASGFNPFYALKHSRNIVQAANEISLAICPQPPDIKDPFWIQQAQAFLTGSILYYYEMGTSFTQTMMAIKARPAIETVAYIMESENDKAKMYMSQFVGMKDDTLNGIFAEVSRNIMIFATDDDLIRALDSTGDCITPQDLENGTDIYCCIEEHLLEQWRPLFTMMVNQFLKHFERRELGNDKPILFLLDEFPRLGKIEGITNALSTLAGRGIHACVIVQSKSQLNDIYGKEKANIIVDNCTYKAILKATEPETQKWCAELVGKFDKEKLSSGKNKDVLGVGKGSSSGKTTEQRYIIEPSEFAYFAERGFLILLTPSGYKQIDKIQWWKDIAFKN